MQIDDEYWEIYKIYIEQAIEFFQSIEPQDHETETLTMQLNSILDHDDDTLIDQYMEMKETDVAFRQTIKRKK